MIEVWNRFWFAPVDARSLALMRITLGLMIIVFWLSLWPDTGLWFSERGPMDVHSLQRDWSVYRWSYLDPLSDTQVWWAHAAGFVVVLCFTFGLGTRVANVLLMVALVAVWGRAPWIQNGGDRLIRIWVFTLCWAPSGAAWSVDAWLRRRRDRGRPPAQVAVLPMRLIQLQLMAMYTWTAVAKWDGSTWRHGTAIYFALSDGSFERFPVIVDALLRYPIVRALAALSTWATLAFEGGFAVLVLFRRTRPWALAAGVLLHGGIFVLMSVGLFSWASVWGYLAFLPFASYDESVWSDLGRVFGRWRARGADGHERR